MVAERIGSALIMESDADWDMRIKDIMTSIAQGAKTIVDWPFNVPKNQTQNTNESPYGENWDIIWIGHCGSENNGYGRIYSWNDTTVPPEDREYTFAQPPQDEQHRPGTRFIYQFHSTVCSTGYAISLQGAVKLDEYFKEGSENLDIELMNLCSSKRDLTCLAVWPQVITAASTKSNIEHPEGEIAAYESDEVVVQPGPALQYSARVNADQVISKGLGRESWVAEWNSTWTMFNSTWTQVDFDDTEEMRNWEKVKNGTDGITKI
ncbi:hypothetical protein MMC28_007540 [Mycoblastus sanguinarius]|nr:hypothetical protein [Mycoblastus sanguinarius]